jgi:flagellar biosynthesis component FlhA
LSTHQLICRPSRGLDSESGIAAGLNGYDKGFIGTFTEEEPQIREVIMTETKTNVKHDDLAKVREADLLLVRETDLAVALEYSPGRTPRVVAKGERKKAGEMIWIAQETGVPILEVVALEKSSFKECGQGEEIPRDLYRPVASALAMLYKNMPSPHPVRFMKSLGRRPSFLRRKAAEDVDALNPLHELFPLSVSLGEALWKERPAVTEAIAGTRQRITLELGLVLPDIPLTQNLQLDEGGYELKFRDVPSGRGTLEIPLESSEKVSPLLSRLRGLVHRHGWELLGYCEVEALLENLRKHKPSIVRELFPRHFSIPSLKVILRNLLREQISIRDFPTIIETVVDNLPHAKDPDLLTEFVRMAFSHSLCQKYTDPDGYLNVILLSPHAERSLLRHLKETATVKWLDLGLEEILNILKCLSTELATLENLGIAPVMMCTPLLRRFIRRIIEPSFPDLPVLAYSEIAPMAQVRSVAMLNLQ